MTETSTMLLDAAQRVFEQNFDEDVRQRAEAGEWLEAQWNAIEEFGAPLILLSEDEGGFGLPVRDGFALVRLAAATNIPLPIAETMFANWLRARGGIGLQAGPQTIAPVERTERLDLVRDGSGWRLTGRAKRVPWGRNAGIVVLASAEHGWYIAAVERGAAELVAGCNMAGHPRDNLTFDLALPPEKVAPLPDDLDPEAIMRGGAALRTAAIAGALERTLALAVGYANERVQFGRPIGKFQAVQQNLARLADEAVAASGAADLAAAGFDNGLAMLPIAAGKSRAGEAAGIGASIAHQVIGAIGFTREHSLNGMTRPLWSWREEFGREAVWTAKIGEAAIAAGPAGLWPLITDI